MNFERVAWFEGILGCFRLALRQSNIKKVFWERVFPRISINLSSRYTGV